MASDQLERYRRAVDDEATGAALERLVAVARSDGLSVMGHEELKTALRGFPKGHPRIELLGHKSLVT